MTTQFGTTDRGTMDSARKTTSPKSFLFFDHAATTPCCPEATEQLKKFSCDEYGNPSSSHAMGQCAANAIQDARKFFANTFQVKPNQVIFTGSGSEADNLAIYGIALDALAQKRQSVSGAPLRILVSATEHAAVRQTALSLKALGFDVHLIPVDTQGQIVESEFQKLLTPDTLLVSIHQVNNVTGALLPVEHLASLTKAKVPNAIFHTDAIQSFGKAKIPHQGIDLLSVSGHKINGPKGIGALIVMNANLIKSGLRPLIWGGGQEGGFRSGTPHPGMIAGFHVAAEKALESSAARTEKMWELRDHLAAELGRLELWSPEESGTLVWNSPRSKDQCVPHIINLSAPGYPAGILAKLLEDRHCLVSTGSACSSAKSEGDPVLSSMGLPASIHSSAIRISFGCDTEKEQVSQLAQALSDSLKSLATLLGGNPTTV